MTDQSLDMDAILDEALDELDDDDDDDDSENDVDDDIIKQNLSSSLQHASRKTGTNVVKTVTDDDDSESEDEESTTTTQSRAEIDDEEEEDTMSSPAAVFQNMLRDFIEGDDDDEIDPDERLGKFMDQVQAHLPPDDDNDDDDDDGDDEIIKGNNKSLQQQNDNNNKNDVNGVEQTIAAILEEMSKANIGGGEDGEDHNLQFPGGDIDPSSFGFNPDSFNPDAVIDGMMEQLLSKDLMYEPMKQVSEKFPTWLEENKNKIPSDEYEKRVKQDECFRKLVHVYETQPDNINELLELMQQVQEYGQPPQDIINEIAPGLELDDDGMPKFNPMDGIPGLGGENEECTIM